MDGKVALDTVKSFKEIMSTEDFQTFIKGEDSEKLRTFSEVQEFLKAEMSEEGKKKDDDEDEEGKKKDDENEEKAIDAEFMKAFGDELEGKFETKLKAVTDLLKSLLLKSLLPTSTELGEIKKSIDSVNETVTKIAATPQGGRAIRQGATPEFFAKALAGQSSEDENGKEVLSITASKEKVLKAMEKGMEKAVEDPELVKSYENSILRYNGGGGSIAQEVAIDLFEKHNIRLVR